MTSGLPIAPHELLAGSKIAYKMHGTVFVSPAMYSLMKNANAKDLEDLMQSIQVKDFDPKPKHDMQWYMDTFELALAKMKEVPHD